jgi:hypothetical protein
MNNLEGVDAPEVIIENLLHTMEMQIGRQNESFHIPQKTAQYMWNEAMNKARTYLQIPTKTIKEEFENS